MGLQVIPELSGLDGASVYSTDEVLAGEFSPAGHVVVIDENGHWEAAGTAEFLVDAGCRVTVVTRRNIVAQDLEATNYAMFIKRITEKGVSCMTLVEVRAVEEHEVVLRNVLTSAVFTLTGVDAVVPVFSRRSRDDLYFELIERLGEDQGRVRVERIGDAAAPRLIQSVLLEAHRFGTSV
jgi:pyruvate/2-oxoglutarate dehydrogenase complex dihydrolipoamide dehydrogenase (E3) component